MPYANNDGVRIYYEVEGQGPPLVLMYGITEAMEVWRYCGYVESLKDDYQLILIDTRGHGASDKPHDPDAYRIATLVSDVVAVLDVLGIARTHYVGFSMGGGIGKGMALDAPDRVYSLVLMDAVGTWDRQPDVTAQRLEGFGFNKPMDEFLVGIKAMSGEWWSIFEAIERSNDLDALAAVLMADEGILSYGEEDGLPWLTVPCLFVGQEVADRKVREYIESMPNATLVELPGLNHVDVICRSDLVLPHIREFLAEVGEG